MHGDVTLVKSALLYADEVELLGLAASLVYATGMAPGVKQPTLSELIELTEIVSKDVVVTPEMRQTITIFEQLERRGAQLPIEYRAQAEELRRFTAEAGALLREASDGIARDTGLDVLQPAIDGGIVSVTDLGLRRADTIRAATGQSLGSDVEMKRFSHHIHRRLNDARTHLLFDVETASLVESMVHEQQIQLSSSGRLLLGKAALGAGLVARLPAFPEANIDEILHLRGDLAGPLRKYRSAVVRLSRSIADLPVDELDRAVQTEWEATVSPALDEIGSSLIDHGLVRELSRQARQDAATYVTMASGLFVGMDRFTDLNGALAGLVSALPAFGGSVGKASLARSDARATAEKSDFYFLYSANRMLAPE